MVGGSRLMSKTVDSRPTAVSPPLMIQGRRPLRSVITWFAVVGLGRPERLALGAAMGLPKDAQKNGDE